MDVVALRYYFEKEIKRFAFMFVNWAICYGSRPKYVSLFVGVKIQKLTIIWLCKPWDGSTVPISIV